MNMNLFKEIGGYFQLELRKGKEYHSKAIKLNTGRNALEYILRAKKYKKVFLPYYTCDVLLEPINKLNIKIEYYHIDQNFKPLINPDDLKDNEGFIFTNYFGICDKLVKELSINCKNLIVDNAQAFYSNPIRSVDTFYSARKFFGVPDGAYLYTDIYLDLNLPLDYSKDRLSHLIGRVEMNAEKFYDDFKKNENKLCNLPIKRISNITKALLSNIDYKKVAKKRIVNFEYLHKELKELNELNLDLFIDNNLIVPMVYPFLTKNGNKLRQKLISKKIYVPTYWPNLPKTLRKKDWEYYLVNNLLPLPIDQRYDKKDLIRIIEVIK